nr:class I SAM-dependent methyltransferase [Evansella caseinilytica]
MLDYTGERVIPELMKPDNGMLLEHCARYYFASMFTRGRVLDIACGVGYGCKMLLEYSRHEISEIVGADVDENTIAYAKKHYLAPKITFTTADIMDIRLTEKLQPFDTIVSFETIEHIKDEAFFIRQMRNLLKPGGTLILSTPFGQGKNQPSKWPFHYFQLTQEEFKKLFTAFSAAQFYYQCGVIIEPQRGERHYPIGIAVATK